MACRAGGSSACHRSGSDPPRPRGTGSRALGGRPRYRQGQPDGCHHDGGPPDPLHDAPLALPQGKKADHVADVLIEHVSGLPALVRKSLTWGQCTEL